MDFDKTFLEERGIKYNEDSVENYDRKKAETQTLVEMNNTLEEVKSQIAKATAYSDSARVKLQMNQIMSFLKAVQQNI